MRQPDKTLAPLISPILKGFKKRYNLALSFQNESRDGFYNVQFNSETWPAGAVRSYGYHEVEVFFSLRCNAVTDLILAMEERDRENMNNWGPNDGRFTVQRMVNYYPFDDDRDKEWTIRHDRLEADCIEAAEKFRDLMETEGFAWFERYSDPLNISRDVNEPIGAELKSRKGHPLMPRHSERAKIGLAAACVAEPERVPELYQQWLDWVRAADEYHMGRGTRSEPNVPRYECRFDYIIDEARKVGYDV
ncbi:MAG: hypothetical protein AAGK17_08555 [Pseudomonadota bacterium]